MHADADTTASIDNYCEVYKNGFYSWSEEEGPRNFLTAKASRRLCNSRRYQSAVHTSIGLPKFSGPDQDRIAVHVYGRRSFPPSRSEAI